MIRILAAFLIFSPFTALADSGGAKACEPLDAQLKADPESVDLHKKLIECYFHAEIASLGSPSQRAELEKARAEQLRWMAQHAPTDEFACSPSAVIFEDQYPDDYVAIKSAWMTQVEAHPKDARVLADAACFMAQARDKTKAEELAAKAHGLDPHNIEASITLAHLYDLDRIIKPEQKAQFANQSLQLREQIMDALSPLEKMRQIRFAAQDAFDTGDDAKAGKYAELLLQLAQQGPGHNDGDAIHWGNLVLGRIALRQGNLEEAKTRLLAAGNTPGSPVLGSFGPNMALAKELLEKQQTEVVLQYFDECEKFWTAKMSALSEWRETVRQGGIPNFGGNLVY